MGSTRALPVAADASSTVSFAYVYIDANQRVRRTDTDGSFWLFDYDSLGQLINGKHYWTDGTPVAGQQFEYGFDDIGNRTATKEGGDQTGAALRSASYSANSLNQYTSRDVPGAADIIGAAHASASISANGDSSVYRHGEYFWKELSITNASAPVWQNVSVIGSLTGTNQTNAGYLFLPKAQETFAHDADGNLTNDGRWVWTWDAENRLAQIESYTNAPAGSKLRLTYTYDSQSRLVRRTLENGSSGSYVATNDQKLVWNDWLCFADLNATNNSRERSYLWGLDLSGSLQGAGGIGGLIAVSTLNSQPSTAFCAYDGNGNVATLINAADSSLSARYEYDSFGRTLRATGPMATANPMRFSTKRADSTVDLAYYGYRFYVPIAGRWLNRDPIGEKGGNHLYLFVNNHPPHGIDIDGREYPPPRQSRVLIPAGYNCCCCTSETIQKGRAKLMQYYNAAASILDAGIRAGKLTLAAEEKEPTDACCEGVNRAVLSYMSATPACWICWIERRIPNWPTGYNENSIVCMAISEDNGNCREQDRIVFDYFDEAFHRGWADPPYIIKPGTPYLEYSWKYHEADANNEHHPEGWYDPPKAYDDCLTESAARPGRREYLDGVGLMQQVP